MRQSWELFCWICGLRINYKNLEKPLTNISSPMTCFNTSASYVLIHWFRHCFDDSCQKDGFNLMIQFFNWSESAKTNRANALVDNLCCWHGNQLSFLHMGSHKILIKFAGASIYKCPLIRPPFNWQLIFVFFTFVCSNDSAYFFSGV